MNKNRMIILVTATALVLGLLLGRMIFNGSGSGEAHEDHVHETEQVGETIWTCSMHPQIRQNEPGDCPICGMDLIPLDKDDAGQENPMAIRMSPAAMQLASVQTAVVGSRSPHRSVRLNGKVQADERMVYSQSSHIPGRIEALKLNFTGEYVRKGQVIASVYSPDLVTAQEELFEAYKIRETHPELLISAREKLKNWKLSDQQIEQILQSGVARETFDIRADISGYVTEKKVNTGDYISRGESIYEIADLSRVWLLFDVYESDMSWVKTGNPVRFTIASLPGETFEGTISYLDPVIDRRSRVAKARVEVANGDQKLKPEMFASGIVEAKLPGSSDGIVVPKTAVMWTGVRSVVYVRQASDAGVYFLMREVTLGPALGESYIIQSGLQEGEEIAVNGAFSIDAAAQLAGKPSMMNPEGGPVMTGHNHGARQKPVAPETNPIGRQAKTALQPLYVRYMRFKEALTHDDLPEARKAASEMHESTEEIDSKLFSGQAGETWNKQSSSLISALGKVSNDQWDIDDVRLEFENVSLAMINLSRAFRPLNQPLYVQYCPMVDDNRGTFWLSGSEEIRNPYFGSAMLNCGEVTDTIE